MPFANRGASETRSQGDSLDDPFEWSAALAGASATVFGVVVWAEARRRRDRMLHAWLIDGNAGHPDENVPCQLAADAALEEAPPALVEALLRIAAAWFAHRRPLQRHAIIFETEIAVRLALHGMACAPATLYASVQGAVSQHFDWTVSVENFLLKVRRDGARWRRVLGDLPRQGLCFGGDSADIVAHSHQKFYGWTVP